MAAGSWRRLSASLQEFPIARSRYGLASAAAVLTGGLPCARFEIWLRCRRAGTRRSIDNNALGQAGIGILIEPNHGERYAR